MEQYIRTVCGDIDATQIKSVLVHSNMQDNAKSIGELMKVENGVKKAIELIESRYNI